MNVLAVLAVCSSLTVQSAQSAPEETADEPAQTVCQPEAPARRFSGNISWYGVPFHGRKTASGRIYDMNKLTCAHRTLPFGTKILIENPRNGRSVIVEVIDRGPYAQGRIIDVSREAARQLGTLLGGVAYVNCLVVYMPGDKDQ